MSGRDSSDRASASVRIQAIGLVSRVDPAVGGRTLTEGYLAQPVIMARGRPTPELKQARAVNPLVGEGDIDDDPEPPSAAPRYAVQLGPYKSRKTAVSTRALLARRGYSAALSGRALRVGSFSTVARADRLASRLRKSGYRPLVVATN